MVCSIHPWCHPHSAIVSTVPYNSCTSKSPITLHSRVTYVIRHTATWTLGVLPWELNALSKIDASRFAAGSRGCHSSVHHQGSSSRGTSLCICGYELLVPVIKSSFSFTCKVGI